MCASKEKGLDYLEKDMPLESINGNYLNNLLDLSSDMKYLLKNNIMPDVRLRISGKDEMYCHRDILKFRSKWFYNAVCEADAKGAGVIEIDEDSRVMEAVLCYMYTGDLRLLESLDVYLVEVYEAAEKFGFTRLREILKRMLHESKYREIMKYTQFQWLVKIDDCRIQDSKCPALDNFTICENDKWQMKIKCISSSDDDESGYNVAIYLERRSEESCATVHSVNLDIRIMDRNEKCRYYLYDKHDFHEDGEYALKKHIPLTKLIKEYGNMLSDGRMLTLTCDLTFWARVGFLMRFKLPSPYRRYITNELVHLSEDMFNVFRDGRTHDISFRRCHVKIHSYILLVRSRLQGDFINELEKQSGYNKRLWISFASFLYTGQSRFLDEHARAVYFALSELKLSMAREKYSKFLARNLTLENAFCIMNDAVFHQDQNLLLATTKFLDSNGYELTIDKTDTFFVS